MNANAPFHSVGPRPPARAGRVLFCFAALLLAVAALCGCSRQHGRAPEEIFQVRKGDLDITVTETGSLEAAESQNIINNVTRNLKILEIVDEGTNITEEDVKKGKVLVRLDGNEVEDQVKESQSKFESAKASLTDAQEALTITQSENESNIRGAELDLEFALNDLRRLVGETLAAKYLKETPKDIAALLDDPALGGQALQDLNTYRNDITLAEVRLNRAQEKVKYTRQLFTKSYVSKNELEGDELEAKTCELDQKTKGLKLDIFRRYEFVKDFQKTWSTGLEAREKLKRQQAVARSKLAQVQARLNSQQAAFDSEKERLERLKADVESCTIKATKPGFVVYKNPPQWSNKGPIRAGTEVGSKETIIELPDLSRMVVKITVHEAQIDLVNVGQGATIKIDALPDRQYTGKVTRKAVLASSQDRWMNPGVKVYETWIAVNEQDQGLRPGMTAGVEIVAERLKDVIYVPIQAVQTADDGKHSCFLDNDLQVPVQIGKRNETFVVITKGLKGTERLLMTPPALSKMRK